MDSLSVSPSVGWSNTLRSDIPVRVEIHSSDVSTTDSRSRLVITVLGAADPMPVMRQLSGPVVTMESVVLDDDGDVREDGLTILLCPTKDVGWKAAVDEKSRDVIKVVDESLILNVCIDFKSMANEVLYIRCTCGGADQYLNRKVAMLQWKTWKL